MRILMIIAVLAIASVSAAQDADVETQVDETAAAAPGAPETAEEAAEADDAEVVEEKPAVDAYAEAAEIMQFLCMECHGDAGHDYGFKLPTTREGAGMAGVPSIQRTDLMLIDLEKPESSYLMMKLRDDDGILGQRMPMARLLDEEQLSMFDLWIAELSEAYLASLELEDADAGAADVDDADDDAGHDGDDDGECDDDKEHTGDDDEGHK